jgi:hypothetical protein
MKKNVWNKIRYCLSNAYSLGNIFKKTKATDGKPTKMHHGSPHLQDPVSLQPRMHRMHLYTPRDKNKKQIICTGHDMYNSKIISNCNFI